jgi:hypothetical protein
VTTPPNRAEHLPQSVSHVSARYRRLLRYWVVNLGALVATAMASWLWTSIYLFVAFLLVCSSALVMGCYLLKEALNGTFAAGAEDSE